MEMSPFTHGTRNEILMPSAEEPGVSIFDLSGPPFGLICKYDKYVGGIEVVVPIPASVSRCISPGNGGMHCK
jgi:hypothetical protein